MLNGTEDGKRHHSKGHCCANCAAGLMKKLAGRNAKERAEKEAELQAEHLDVTDLQKRRRVNFGNVHTHRGEKAQRALFVACLQEVCDTGVGSAQGLFVGKEHDAKCFVPVFCPKPEP